MPPNLRLSLTIFAIGFAIEAVGDAYRLLTGTILVGQGQVLFYVSAVTTGFGFLFLWLGRHEWNELHRQRVAAASWVLVGVILVGIVAAVPVGFYAVFAPGSAPGWVGWITGAGVAIALFLTFVVYAVIVVHLVGWSGRTTLALGLLSTVVVAYWFGLAVVAELPALLANLPTDPGGSISAVMGAVPPILAPLSWLVVPYLFFLVVFADAHHRTATEMPGGKPVVADS